MTQISVIVPVYNSEKYLVEAIESILSQTYKPLEVIVVDDGSEDRSAEIVKGFAPAVTYVHQANQGIGLARNKGISIAVGDFFAFLDADDIWLEDKLERQMVVLENDGEVDLVYGHARQFFSPELAGQIEQKVRIIKEVLPAQISSAMLIRRASFFRVGLYETNMVGVDQSWYMRAVDKKLNIVMLPDILYLRRIHDNNQGWLHRHAQQDRLHAIKSALDRRRRQQDG